MKTLCDVASLGKGEYLAYTEDQEVHRALIRFNGRFATYFKNSRKIGWHHIVHRSALVYLERHFLALKNQLLTSVVSEDLACGEGVMARNSPDQEPVRNEPIREDQVPAAPNVQDADQGDQMTKPSPVRSDT